jgi:hypothetical protein
MTSNRLLIAALVTLVSSPALAETITGQASVVDGDSLKSMGSAFACRVSTHPSLPNSVAVTTACNIDVELNQPTNLTTISQAGRGKLMAAHD